MKSCLWLWLVLAMVSSAHAELNLYVWADAAGGGDGSRNAPFQTLTQARDAVRTLRRAETSKSAQAVTVHIAPGVYPLEASFELRAEDGGTAAAPVLYRATQAGKARFQGGIALDPASFGPVGDPGVLSRLDPAVRDKVRVCDLAARLPAALPEFKTAFRGAPVAPWLYVNRQPMTLARWPNVDAAEGGWAGFSEALDTGLPRPDAADPSLRVPHPGSFRFDDPRPARWNLAEGVWLLGYWTHDWSDEVIRIASYDAQTKTVTLAAPHSYGINAGTWGAKSRRFFALNALEELDSPGEWYL
ncbi:MAG: hypothetical protein ACYC6Y_15955, partial [Thermoguttaceae bacterium]